MKTEPFVPHELSYLESVRAFPDGAMPEVAYRQLCAKYEAAGSPVQRIEYQSDGLRITGMLARPEGAPRGIVIYNRGGKGDYGILTVHAALRQFVPLARAGYLVAGSNYRGNDGGEGTDEFGGRDVDDVVALHTLLEKSAPGLPTFLIGHSRGGMMNFLLMKRGFSASAVIAIAPVCDVRGWEKLPVEMRQDRTVLNWPEAINAPLLLLHGTKDEAIAHTHSEALSAALTQYGKPHELVLYEGGNHALTRHWDDVTTRTLNWLDRHG